MFATCSSTVLCQEYRLSGSVENTESAPILYANVLLLKASDSTVLKGTSTDEKGEFYIDKVTTGRFPLVAGYIENTSEYVAINVVVDTKVGALLIDETTENLDEVVVTYQKPRLERKVDRLVFNVANTSLSDGTICDLLKHTPSVSDIQGVLTVKGSSDITVMINSRKINLPKSDVINLLSGASASSVESIEVITNPPSKYSAEGGMLIDIKMSKNLVSGYNGAVFNQYRQGVFAKHTIGADHYFKGKKSGFSVNYSFNKDKWLTKFTDVTNFTENNVLSLIWTVDQNRTLRRNRHNLSAFFDYQINENNALSFATINTFNPKVDRSDDSRTGINDVNGNSLSSFNKDLFKFWNSYLLVSYWLKRDSFNDIDSGQLIENSQDAVLARSGQSFTLLNDRSLFIDLQYYYRSSSLYGNNRTASISMFDVTIRKNIRNKKGSTLLGVMDIFKTVEICF